MFIKKLYKFSYTAGTIFLILSIMMSFVPAFPTNAQAGAGAIWTTEGSCGNPQDANQYEIGQDIYIHYENFEAGVPFSWNIVGVSGPDKGVAVASGNGTITYEYDNNTKGCFYAYTVQQGDSGTYKVTLSPEGGNAKTDNYIVSGDEPTPTPPPPTLALTVEKTATPTSVQEPGGLVTFTVNVTNDSDVPVTLTSLTDQIEAGAVTDICSTGQTLAVGETYSCDFQVNVTGAAGESQTDTVRAVISADGQTAQGQDTAIVTIVEEPLEPILALTVEKTANPTSVQEPGGLVTFTVNVTNDSNVPVTLSSLTDQIEGGAVTDICSTGQTLQIDETYTCDFQVNVTGVAGDSQTDTVRAVISYQDLDEQGQDTARVTIVEEPPQPLPSITVVKSASPTELDATGGDVTFTVEVTNNSSIPVEINSIIDDVFGDLDNVGDCAVGEIIPAEGLYSCSFTRTLNINNGNPHNNTVTVQVVDDQNNTDEDSDNAIVNFNLPPEISVSKTANPTQVSEVGGLTTFTVVVENPSTEQLTLNSLTDSMFNNLGTCSVPQILPAGGSYTCSFSAFLTGEPGTPHTNVITASATDSDGNPATDSDDAVVTFSNVLPAITVEKTAFPTTIDEPGGFVEFTFLISNTSQEQVTLSYLNDDVYGNLNQVTGGEGAIGQIIAAESSFSCTISGLVTGNSGEVHTNTVVATARDNDGNGDTATDFADVIITDVPTDILVTKTANQEEIAEPGGDVSYTVRIDNLTTESITLTSLTDDLFSDLNGQGTCSVPQVIAGSGFYECEFTGAVAGDAGYAHVNTVTGTAEDDDGGEVSDSDSARVLVTDVVPSIEVTKTADPKTIPAPLGGVTYTVEIQNLSDEDVNLDDLTDDKFGDLNGAGDCLIGGVIPAGGTYICSFVEVIPGLAGETHTNVITATVSDNEQNSVSDDDDATVTFTEAPELYLVDPCSVDCDLPTVQGQLCNGDFANAYTGTVDWQIFVGNTEIGQGTILGVPAGECVDLSAPQSGDGLYSVVATLVDEDGETITTSCGPLSCQVEEPPSEPPVTPPTGTPTGVFIPVTGLDLSSNSMMVMLQNLGLALLSFGLVMHGFSLQGRKKSKKQ